MPVIIVQWCTEIGLFDVRLNLKQLKLKYRRRFRFSGSCWLFLLLLTCAGDIELTDIFMIFH